MRRDLRGPLERRPGQGQLACFADDGNPVGIDDSTLADCWRLRLPPPGAGDLLAFSPNGDSLAVTVTHACRVFVFSLTAGGEAREIGRGEAGVLGLGWPAPAATPSWLDSGANVLHAWDSSTRCVGQKALVQPDGSRVAVLGSEGWRPVRDDSTDVSLGPAMPANGCGWMPPPTCADCVVIELHLCMQLRVPAVSRFVLAEDGDRCLNQVLGGGNGMPPQLVAQRPIISSCAVSRCAEFGAASRRWNSMVAPRAAE